MLNRKVKRIAVAVGAAVAAQAATSAIAEEAIVAPFEAAELEGVLLADAHYEGACGEGRCGATEARCTEDDSTPPTEEESDRAFPSTRVALPSETTGALGLGEVNLVRFEVPARCVVKAETAGEIDTFSILYNADGNRIASGRGRSILRLLDAGTYYVRIASNRAGSYMLRLGFEVGDDGHGESLASAARVALPSETAATIVPFDDEDFFGSTSSDPAW